MDAKEQNLRTYLQEELLARCRKNGGYSLRSFARNLQINPSTLSQILRGKRVLTKKRALQLCEALNIPPLEIRPDHANEIISRKKLKQLSVDTFNIIADWYHHALLELPRLKNFQSDPKWAARILGISVTEVHIAIERLQRVGLLKVENGKWIVLSQNNSAIPQTDISSAARRRLQIQILELAKTAVEQISTQNRKNVSVTLAFNTRRLKEAKKRIDEFRQDFPASMDSKKSCDSVYNLAIAFYPVTKA